MVARAALALLTQRGLDAAELDALWREAQRVSPDSPDHKAEALAADRALWAWYLEWS